MIGGINSSNTGGPGSVNNDQGGLEDGPEDKKLVFDLEKLGLSHLSESQGLNKFLQKEVKHCYDYDQEKLVSELKDGYDRKKGFIGTNRIAKSSSLLCLTHLPGIYENLDSQYHQRFEIDLLANAKSNFQVLATAPLLPHLENQIDIALTSLILYLETFSQQKDGSKEKKLILQAIQVFLNGYNKRSARESVATMPELKQAFEKWFLTNINKLNPNTKTQAQDLLRNWDEYIQEGEKYNLDIGEKYEKLVKAKGQSPNPGQSKRQQQIEKMRVEMLQGKQRQDHEKQIRFEIQAEIDPASDPDRKDAWDNPSETILNRAANKKRVFIAADPLTESVNEKGGLNKYALYQKHLLSELAETGFESLVIHDDYALALIEPYIDEIAGQIDASKPRDKLVNDLKEYFADDQSIVNFAIFRGDELKSLSEEAQNSLKLLTEIKRLQVERVKSGKKSKIEISYEVFDDSKQAEKTLYLLKDSLPTIDDSDDYLCIYHAQGREDEDPISRFDFMPNTFAYLHNFLSQNRGWGDNYSVCTELDEKILKPIWSKEISILNYEPHKSLIPDIFVTSIESDTETMSEENYQDDKVELPDNSLV